MVDWMLLGTISVVAALFSVRFLTPRPATGDWSKSDRPDNANDPVFLFEDALIVDSSPAAKPILSRCSDPAQWDDVRNALSQSFPGIPEDPNTLSETGPLVLSGIAQDCRREALCEWVDGAARIHLRQCVVLSDPKDNSELQNLRVAMDAAPYPIWRENNEGQITWHNQAYETLQHNLQPDGFNAAEPLFPHLSQKVMSGNKSRVSLVAPANEQKLWFDVSTIRTKGDRLNYAVDVNAVVDAEVAQRNFVQTLAKTFAQLSIGLAIFDRNMQLALFNPALIDLTNLQADFLSSRPTLFNFFDRLRDQRGMPEPKDYSSWRQQISDLVASAADGRYQETWSLPSGSVYSVSGRPHPDGAVAFLFEDITAEITLTRRFRSELEMGQAILDTMDQSIAVFSADGNLAFSNTPYHDLWGVDPEKSFAQVTILDACKIWQEKCRPTMVWGRLNDFVHARELRQEWADQVQMRDGPTLTCKVTPIQNGATLVGFVPVRTRTEPDVDQPQPAQSR
ncbi:MAG: PAS domain-containing protein [Rhodobacteraceae bacterium]|nr:PAS domain-containing protein [Paracoccaceae bacterium]